MKFDIHIKNMKIQRLYFKIHLQYKRYKRSLNYFSHYLYILIEFRKLIMVLESVKNAPNLIR